MLVKKPDESDISVIVVHHQNIEQLACLGACVLREVIGINYRSLSAAACIIFENIFSARATMSAPTLWREHVTCAAWRPRPSRHSGDMSREAAIILRMSGIVSLSINRQNRASPLFASAAPQQSCALLLCHRGSEHDRRNAMPARRRTAGASFCSQ